MADLFSFDELYDIGKTEIQTRNSRLTDFEEGSNLDALNGSGAMLADMMQLIIVREKKKRYIDTATGTDLDAVVTDFYPDLTRQLESASVGTLTFTRGSSTGDLEIPIGTQCEATVDGDKITFETTATATILSAESSVDVAAECTVAGRSGNVAADTITKILDTIPGDSTATVTNSDRFAGGAPEETDEEYRVRAKAYPQTLRKGTTAALKAGSLTVDGVRYATVDESTAPESEGGYVSVYIGDPDGSGNEVLAASVATALEDYRACGVEVRVFGASQELITASMVITIRRGADKSTIDSTSRTNILQYVNTRSPNDKAYFSKMETAAHEASDDVLDATLVSDETNRYFEPTEPYNALRMYESGLSLTFVEEG